MADETGRMSEEDKFLGVRHTIEVPESEEVNVEVVDDRPEEDQRAPAGKYRKMMVPLVIKSLHNWEIAPKNA